MSLVDRRIGLLFAGFLLLLSFAFARSLYLGTIKGDNLARAANVQQRAEEVVPPRRGAMLDRRGIELAISEPASDVSVTPYLVKDPVAAARKLAPLLGKPEADLTTAIARRDTGFVYLRRELPAEKADKVRRLRIEGIALAPSEHRQYPRKWLAAQVLGLVGTDGKGLSGIELARNEQLTGAAGLRRSVRDALGEPLEVRDVLPAKPGKDLTLTLDAQIQDRVEAVLHDLGATFSPQGASAVVLDPRTNEVLAMANWPQVDANEPGEAPASALRNLATNFTYEPGSTFKAFTVAGALEDGTVEPDEQFGLAPTIQVADRVIGESHGRGTVTLTTKEILAQSSNVGAVTIGLKMGDKRFDQWTRRFGFGRATGVDLPGEERGLSLPVEKYSGSTMGNLPIGQGQLVTQMQISTAYAALANGGVLRPAHVVKAIDGEPVPTPKGKRIVSEQTAREVRGMLEGVFAPGGTASEVTIPGYSLAGKTGTANKFDTKLGQYSKAKYVASFVGFAPAKDPRLLISVMVDEPKGQIYGAQVAAPAFGKIARFALPYLKIAPR
ncbi:MAG: penicillin-binding protein 2 [Solirubrobacterales bacterium]|jgi:cell division protein FtsI (penicillin-binding protein 3)|nr:penicillin-binding protein 2 [Solirubrobacterales bacterium]